MKRRQRKSGEKLRRHSRLHPTRRQLLAGAGLTVGATLAAGGSAQAASFAVTSTSDTGGDCDATPSACTLRQAINSADNSSGADTLTFASSLSGSINLASDLPTITGGLSIVGPGADDVAVSGQGAHRVFAIDASAGAFDVSISNLKIQGGSTPGNGGAINNHGASLTLSDAKVLSSHAGGAGGGIYSDGSLQLGDIEVLGNDSDLSGGGIAADAGGSGPQLELSNSTISGNHADGAGGGIEMTGAGGDLFKSRISYNDADLGGGGIATGANPVFAGYSTFDHNHATVSGGAVQITGGGSGLFGAHQTTFSYNNAGGSGGAIDAGGAFRFKQSTIANNYAGGAASGGGISNHNGIGDLGTQGLYNTIVANNSAGAGGDLSGAFDARFTLVENTGGAVIDSVVAGSNIFGVDPQLGPFALGESRAPYRAIAATSPAVDRAANAAYPNDQRGLPRSVDLAGVANANPSGGPPADDPFFNVGFNTPDASDIGAFEVQQAPGPVASSLSPSHGSTAGGTTVTISGSGLSGASAVRFGAAAASFTVLSATQIRATTPAGSGMVEVTVTTPFGTSSTGGAGNDYTYEVVQSPAPPGGAQQGSPQTQIGGDEGSDGTDAITCHGKEATIVARPSKHGRAVSGTDHRDVIVATSGKDTIDAGGGNDVVCAGGGADTVSGGAGNDELYGEGGGDTLHGGGGKDKLRGGSGHDVLSGGPGQDSQRS